MGGWPAGEQKATGGLLGFLPRDQYTTSTFGKDDPAGQHGRGNRTFLVCIDAAGASVNSPRTHYALPMKGGIMVAGSLVPRRSNLNLEEG